MMFAATVTAVASLIFLIIFTNASTLLNTLTFDFRRETHFSRGKENMPEQYDIASNLVKEPSKTFIKSKIYNAKVNSKDYYMCIHIKGMTKAAEDFPFNLKCQIIEKSSDKEFSNIPTSSGKSRKFLPLVDSSITPFELSLFQRKSLNLDTSPVGLGSGILGIGAVDLGHGLGRFMLR
ncbi:hypothetical protein AVEN_116101-1 [Araneus ventricosus]|uniref:Uncharacterized protein n=1 Tax=Araneus ventricosus TaxID=182803 RepID=A0A4Y2M6J2_ARAVE|nr:hypothetical protein AVEN_116101-1 [Araneus ventricosus]